MYFDLNLKIENYTQSKLNPDALELIINCIEDGYSGIAVNTHFSNINIQKDHVLHQQLNIITQENRFQPVNKDILEKALSERQNLVNPKNFDLQKFKQLSRLTLTINDLKFLSQLNDNNKILKTYDLIAIEPLDEKIFHSLCIDYDYYDIITFNLTKKLPFHLKYPPIKEAIRKGIMFEINYSEALENQSIRRMVMANAINLMNYTKGQNLIFSSNCKNQLFHRSPYDLASLGINLGLKRDEAFFTVSKNAENCIKQSIYRKTFKGTISLATSIEKSLFKEKQMQLNLIKKTKKALISYQDQRNSEKAQVIEKEIENQNVIVNKQEDLQSEIDKQQSIQIMEIEKEIKIEKIMNQQESTDNQMLEPLVKRPQEVKDKEQEELNQKVEIDAQVKEKQKNQYELPEKQETRVENQQQIQEDKNEKVIIQDQLEAEELLPDQKEQIEEKQEKVEYKEQEQQDQQPPKILSFFIDQD